MSKVVGYEFGTAYRDNLVGATSYLDRFEGSFWVYRTVCFGTTSHGPDFSDEACPGSPCLATKSKIAASTAKAS